jgi:hypothetical protein
MLAIVNSTVNPGMQISFRHTDILPFGSIPTGERNRERIETVCNNTIRKKNVLVLYSTVG